MHPETGKKDLKKYIFFLLKVTESESFREVRAIQPRSFGAGPSSLAVAPAAVQLATLEALAALTMVVLVDQADRARVLRVVGIGGNKTS